MEDQEKFNQMVIRKMESPKRIQAHQDENLEYVTAAYKKQIIVLLDMADNGDVLVLKTDIHHNKSTYEEIGKNRQIYKLTQTG